MRVCEKDRETVCVENVKMYIPDLQGVESSPQKRIENVAIRSSE